MGFATLKTTLAVEGNVFGLDEALEPTMADLTERFEDPEIVNGVRDTDGRVALAIHDCRKPVIAAINAAAVGVDATITLAMFHTSMGDGKEGARAFLEKREPRYVARASALPLDPWDRTIS